MKASTIAIALTVLHLVSYFARADLVLTQHTFAGAQKTPGVTTMSIKGKKMRTDNDTSSSVIIDADTGDMTTLMHEEKMVMTTNTKQLQALMPKEAQQMKLPETKVTATGKHETIDGYDCEIYTSENSGTVVKMWIATTTYPGYDKLKEALKPMAQMAAPGTPKAPELPGMMIQSEVEQVGIKFTTKLVSLEEKSLTDDLFKAPTNYKPLGQ
jgi:Domain of unknown function (DUF4412)